MKTALLALAIIVWGCFLAGCGGRPGGDPKAAIQRAIEEHLAGRPGLASDRMVLEVTDVEVRGDSADAEVMFRSTSDQAAAMAFHYQLRYEGGQWKVQSGRPSGRGAAHPPPASSPETEVPLPEGHPTVETAPAQP